MKRIYLLLCFAGLLIACNSSNKTEEKATAEMAPEAKTSAAEENNLVPITTDEDLIATALLAAPEESRAGCKVIGYNMAGEFVTLKEGDNEFIVLADNPKSSGFSAACYHKSLEPFMARGRALKAEGKTRDEIFEIREAEAKAGQLAMGNPGATLHIYYGPKKLYNPETSKVEGAKYRYVVYLPFATAETTGLPEQPYKPNHPWIMDANTHKAHIMISPIEDWK